MTLAIVLFHLNFKNISEVQMKRALITGITGQDGSLLNFFLKRLLAKYMGSRDAALCCTQTRGPYIYQDPHVANS